MLYPRVIPCLLLQDRGLVKTTRFRDPTYLGDPINIVRIFNDKEVDELVFLDISATADGRPPPFDFLKKIVDECFMPLGYGGGVHSVDDVKVLFGLGIEKIIVNTHAIENPEFIRSAAESFGSQSIVASIDTRRLGPDTYEVFTQGGRRATGFDPVGVAMQMERYGAGELLLTSIDRDGMMQGYDLTLIRTVTESVGIPVVACGGAGKLEDAGKAVESGASAAAAGSMFVFQGPHRAVLISYATRQELEALFSGSGKTNFSRA